MKIQEYLIEAKYPKINKRDFFSIIDRLEANIKILYKFLQNKDISDFKFFLRELGKIEKNLEDLFGDIEISIDKMNES